MQELLELVPERFREFLAPGNLLRGVPPVHLLRDVVLDLGTRPRAFFGHKKLVFLAECEQVVVERADLDVLVTQLEGRFGHDNRCASAAGARFLLGTSTVPGAVRRAILVQSQGYFRRFR